MNLALSEQLPLIAAAPDGIQKLRIVILELAVRGKLVPQNKNADQPVSLPSNVSAQPFGIPCNWSWVQLGSTVEVLDSLRKPVTKSTRVAGPYPYYGASGIVDHVSNFLFDEDLVLVGEDGAKWGAGDNTAFQITGKTWVNNHAHVLRPIRSIILDRYLVISLVARDLKPYITGITVPKLNQSKLLSIPLSVPPVAEQHRIVAKVDELMALCDRLESEQNDSAAAHTQLVETLLGTLTQSNDAADFEANWKRIAEHFDTLFTTEASINALQKTLLQLAIKGKLVPQHLSDTHNVALVNDANSTRRLKGLAPLDIKDYPFNLPNSWRWVRFASLIPIDKPISYGVLVPGPDTPGGIPLVRLGDLSINSPTALPEKSIASEIDAQYQRTRLEGGEILMGVVGSIGKLGLAPVSWKGANIARAVCRIVPTAEIDKSFLLLLLQSEFMQQSFAGSTKTLAQPTLNIGLIRLAPTPLPPLAEQIRIVAKTEALMAICEQLKASLKAAASAKQVLSTALIQKALEAA